MSFKVGDRVVMHPTDVNRKHWPQLIGVEAIVNKTTNEGYFFITFDKNNTLVPRWGEDMFELALDGLDRILEKL